MNDPTGSPSLIDLHPSLSNMDAVARIIDDMRKAHFPEGTGWEGEFLPSFIAAIDLGPITL